MSVLRRNVLFLLVSQLASWVATLAILVLAPRRLGAEGFGRVQFATAFVGFFNLIGSLGSYQYMVKQIARDRSTVGPLVVTALRLKLFMGLALSALACALGWALGYSNDIILLIAATCVGMNFIMLNEMVVAGLAGMERMARSAVWQTVQIYVGTVLALVVLLTSRSLVAFALAFSVSWLIPLVANFHALRPFLRGGRSHMNVGRAIVLGGVPVFVLTALNLLYSTIDVPILERISGDEVVGWYSLAYRWVGMPIFITTIVVTAFLPQLSALATESDEAFAALTNRAVKLVMAVNIPAAVGMFFIASDLVDLLYGAQFHRAVVLMQLLAPFVPLVGLNTVLATALVASDRHKRYIWVAAGAAVLNPPLSVVSIRLTDHRYGNGAIGASIVTVVTEIFITACAIRMRRPGVMNMATVTYCLRCVGAAAAMGVPLVLLRDANIGVKIVVGCATYSLLSVVVGTVTPSGAREALAEMRRNRRGETSSVEVVDEAGEPVTHVVDDRVGES